MSILRIRIYRKAILMDTIGLIYCTKHQFCHPGKDPLNGIRH